VETVKRKDLPEYITKPIYYNDIVGQKKAIGIWEECLWTFYKHPDGQWVSLEKVGTDAK